MRRIILLILAYIPSALPRTDEALIKYMAEVSDLAGYPAGNDSLEHAICNQILHASNTSSRIPKQLFIKTIHKAVANQAAFTRLEELRNKEKQQREQSKEVNPALV